VNVVQKHIAVPCVRVWGKCWGWSTCWD